MPLPTKSLPLPGEFHNEDCVEGCRRRVADDSVDLIVTDPPYGIDGDKLHKHYNRDEGFVLDGYVEIPRGEYADFSRRWIAQAERILRPGGAAYIVSGYTNLVDILNALRETNLVERNHIIWKYNFGVHTKRKYVSSHYHILYLVKPGAPPTFNTESRFGATEKAENGGSLNYRDREDVWVINREYQPGKTKNKNALPTELLRKIIQYSSNEGDLVCDLFLGGFSTAKVAIAMNRRAMGFEVSPVAYKRQIREIRKVTPGEMLGSLRQPSGLTPKNQNKPWSDEEKEKLLRRFDAIRRNGVTQKEAIARLGEEFGRGRFSVLNVLKGAESRAQDLFERKGKRDGPS